MGVKAVTTIENSIFYQNVAKGSGNRNGGGAIFTNASSTTITNTRFTENTATGSNSNGGAIFNQSRMYIKDSVFESNSAKSYGGAIYNINSAFLDVDNSTFNGNGSMYGGAIYVASGGSANPKVTNSLFEKNVATRRYGAITAGNITISTSTFTENTAPEVGAVGIFGKGLLENNTFTENKATSTDSSTWGGGAIYLGNNSQTTISSNTFTNNESGTTGGAIGQAKATNSTSLANAKLDITGSTFTGNKAETTGGAIDNYFYKGNTQEGYVYVGDSTFEGNSAANGGAIYNHGEQDSAGNSGAMLIEGSTFTANTSSQYGGAIYNASTITINSSVFSGNTANGAANDIYNAGKLDFLNGKTTLGGGIDGTGNTTIGNGAEVVSGTESTITQETITVAGKLTNNNEAENAVTATDITVEETGELTTNASAITVTNTDKEITNKGLVTFTGGTLSGYDVIGTSAENSKVEIDGDVTIASGKTIKNNTVTLEESKTLKLEKEDSLVSSVLSVNDGSTLDIQNDGIGNVETLKITENANWNLKLDIDLLAEENKVDTLTIAENGVDSTSKLTISDLNIKSAKANK